MLMPGCQAIPSGPPLSWRRWGFRQQILLQTISPLVRLLAAAGTAALSSHLLPLRRAWSLERQPGKLPHLSSTSLTDITCHDHLPDFRQMEMWEAGMLAWRCSPLSALSAFGQWCQWVPSSLARLRVRLQRNAYTLDCVVRVDLDRTAADRMIFHHEVRAHDTTDTENRQCRVNAPLPTPPSIRTCTHDAYTRHVRMAHSTQ
mmetsp:Transcript_50985/g.101403  ORF Transcript_50985/g.101403 Transcript_50985/m.101403 type:complete len:202 (-) Transcript_50985:56-661(-)